MTTAVNQRFQMADTHLPNYKFREQLALKTGKSISVMFIRFELEKNNYVQKLSISLLQNRFTYEQKMTYIRVFFSRKAQSIKDLLLYIFYMIRY